MRRFSLSLTAGAILSFAVAPAFAQAPALMRVVGDFSTNVRHSEGIERAFFTDLPAAGGERS